MFDKHIQEFDLVVHTLSVHIHLKSLTKILQQTHIIYLFTFISTFDWTCKHTGLQLQERDWWSCPFVSASSGSSSSCCSRLSPASIGSFDTSDNRQKLTGRSNWTIALWMMMMCVCTSCQLCRFLLFCVNLTHHRQILLTRLRVTQHGTGIVFTCTHTRVIVTDDKVMHRSGMNVYPLRTDNTAGAELNFFGRFPRLINILRGKILQRWNIFPTDQTHKHHVTEMILNHRGWSLRQVGVVTP